MAREVDAAWIEQAVERYQRIEARFGEFEKATHRFEVTVRSPDGLVEVLVTAAGTITDVRIRPDAEGRPPAELSRSVRAAVTSAAEAATWAREKLRAETFADYRPIGEGRPW